MSPLGAELEFEPLKNLRPDPANPRLPPKLQNASGQRLYTYLERNYDAIIIAESIAEFGYFASEPLVVIPGEGDLMTVVEGNRRLTALKGLTRPTLRAKFRNPKRWDELAKRAKSKLPAEIPVIKADTWEEAAPLIGFRHIAGIERWRPYPKARFIARLVDDDKMKFSEVSALVGDSEAAVRALYRNQAIVEEGREILGDGKMDAENLFGTFTAALNRRALREYIGVVAPGKVKAGEQVLAPKAAARFRELLSWLYGDDDEDPVIGESRDLGKLARVVESSEALDELRRTRDLALADELAGGPGARLNGQVQRAASYLEAAHGNVRDADEDTPALLDRCTSALRRLRAALKD